MQLRDALDAEVEARSNAESWLESLPTESVLRALSSIHASVNTALKQAESMAALQERLVALLPVLQSQRPDPSSMRQLDKKVQKLKREAEGLVSKARYCQEDGDVDDAKEVEHELQQVRLELSRVVKERRQHLVSGLALVGQFPELLQEGSEHYISSLQQMLDSDGLDMGMQSRSLFSDMEVIASQESRHIVYKARLGDQW
jgi:hypothetical protein